MEFNTAKKDYKHKKWRQEWKSNLQINANAMEILRNRFVR